MAKSLRSKVKRSFRSQKRESGVYAATEAARLNRLNAKLRTVASRKENEVENAENQDPIPQHCQDSPGQHTIQSSDRPDGMAVDASAVPPTGELERVSTHGPRGSRRETWRISKGLEARRRRKGTIRLDGRTASRSKSSRH